MVEINLFDNLSYVNCVEYFSESDNITSIWRLVSERRALYTSLCFLDLQLRRIIIKRVQDEKNGLLSECDESVDSEGISLNDVNE